VYNEEQKLSKMLSSTALMLFMLTIGVFFGYEWAIIILLSLIYTKEGSK